MPRNFAIRLTCSYGDADSWVTLSNREETVEQILHQTWEFTCREHGAQRGIPQEVFEVAPLHDLRASQPQQTSPSDAKTVSVVPPIATQKKTSRSSQREYVHIPVVVYGRTDKCGTFQEETETVVVNSSGAQVRLRTRIEVGDNVYLLRRSSRAVQEVRVASLEASSPDELKVGLAFKQPILDFWKRSRKAPRIPKTLRVVVKGGDAKGNYFIQSAYTIDLSREGARLDGVGFLTTPGQIIEVRRLWRKARFRVVWIGQIGTAESNQVGVFRLQPDKDIWHVPLPKDEVELPPKKSKPSKKVTEKLTPVG
jgi:hypothetical protein